MYILVLWGSIEEDSGDISPLSFPRYDQHLPINSAGCPLGRYRILGHDQQVT